MVRVENISKRLGDFFLKDVSLEVETGEYLMILGPTGSGKTILLETIAGIYPPDRGKVYLNNRDITGWPPRKRKVGMVYQDYMLFPHLNVEENIGYGMRLKRMDRREAAGIVLRITVDAGLPFVAAITRRSFLDMDLEPGKKVFLTFKATDVHVF